MTALLILCVIGVVVGSAYLAWRQYRLAIGTEDHRHVGRHRRTKATR